MNKLKNIAEKIFPSNPKKGEIGSIKLNVWLANITGVPIIGLKEESFGLKLCIFLYGLCLTTFVTFIYTGCELYDLVMNWNDLDILTQNICLSLTHVTGAAKTINILYRLEDVKGILEKIKYMTRTYIKSDKQLQTFHSGDLENKIVLLIYMTIVTFTALLSMAVMYSNPDTIAGKTFPYRVILPLWLPQQLQLLYMGLSVLIFAIQIVAVDYLNVNIINQLRFQLNILNLSFDDLIVDTTPHPNPKQDKILMIYKQDPVERLNAIIEHHCLINRLRRDAEDIFCQPVLLQFFTSLMIFAMTGFQATVRAGGSSGAVLIYFYCGCIFCQLFVYCWFGNEVFEQSKTLATSGFNSSWYQFDRRYGKSLLVFLTNAQQPFLFTAGGFMALSLPSFAGILSKSYSYIALLRQIYGR